MQGKRSERSVGVREVEVRRVGVSFGATVALRGVSARFTPGRLHLLVGSNGSGKTTLLRVVSTMLRPSFGRVLFDGAQVLDRSKVGWVSHESLLYPDLTGRQNLALAAGLQGVGPGAVERSVARFGIGRYLGRSVRTMSRGQRQRVALARALMHEPSLILLDEPSTGLDSDGIEMLLAVIDQEVRRDRVVLVVTHEPKLFENAVKRVLRLERGRASVVA